MRSKYTFGLFTEELKQVSVESEYLSLLSHNPDALKSYNSKILNISNESFNDADAGKVVDKGFEVASKILNAAWKILKAIYAKLKELGKKFTKFLELCRQRGNKVKHQLTLSMNESKKLVRAAITKCDGLIERGVTNDYTLSDLVDMVKESTGVKTKPIEADSPAFVRQWLETLLDSQGLRFNHVKGLEYTIPEKQWYLFAFHPKKIAFSTDLVKMQTDINNYYLKFVLQLRSYFSQERLFAIIRETIQGKYTLPKEIVIESIVGKLIDPLFRFESLREFGNITPSCYLENTNKTAKDVYEASHNKLTGLEAAVNNFLPAIKDGDHRVFIPYQSITTNMDEMVEYSIKITKALDTIYTNQRHLTGKNGSELETQLPHVNQLRRLLDEVLSDQVDNRAEIATAIAEIGNTLERVKQKAYEYWQKISASQLQLLDRQQLALDTFLPVV